MNNKVKQIIRLSFHKDFFIDIQDMKSNYEYLDALVDLTLENMLDKSDYDTIANKVWQYDIRIKDIVKIDLEIMSLCFCEIDGIDASIYNNCSELISLEDIRKIMRCSKTEDEFIKSYHIATVLFNWNSLSFEQKKNVINIFDLYLKNRYGIVLDNDLRKVKIYIDDDTIKTIAINELIFWLSREQGIKTSHQSLEAIMLLRDFEKAQMYFQYNNLLSSRDYEGFNDQYNEIISRIIRPVSPVYNDAGYEDIFEGCERGEKYWVDAYLYIQNFLCRLIFDSQKEKRTQKNILNRLKNESKNKQLKIDDLEKQLSLMFHNTEAIINSKNAELDSLNDELSSLKHELSCLREFMFARSHSNNDSCTENSDVYMGDYKRVVFFGGHKKWQKKVADELEGATIISTDQNVIDWNFMKRMKLVVIVTNYISHSMYYRVVNKIKNQTLVYVEFKNITQLKNEVDRHMLVLSHR